MAAIMINCMIESKKYSSNAHSVLHIVWPEKQDLVIANWHGTWRTLTLVLLWALWYEIELRSTQHWQPIHLEQEAAVEKPSRVHSTCMVFFMQWQLSFTCKHYNFKIENRSSSLFRHQPLDLLESRVLVECARGYRRRHRSLIKPFSLHLALHRIPLFIFITIGFLGLYAFLHTGTKLKVKQSVSLGTLYVTTNIGSTTDAKIPASAADVEDSYKHPKSGKIVGSFYVLDRFS